MNLDELKVSNDVSSSFNKYQGKTCVWYVGTAPNEADHIFCVTDQTGMAGRTMQFKLTNGGVDTVTGPWMSNADMLFDDAGIDVRDFSLVSYVIESDGDVLAQETNAICNYKIPNRIAEQLATKLGKPVRLLKRGSSGGESGYIKPIPDPLKALVSFEIIPDCIVFAFLYMTREQAEQFRCVQGNYSNISTTTDKQSNLIHEINCIIQHFSVGPLELYDLKSHNVDLFITTGVLL